MAKIDPGSFLAGCDHFSFRNAMTAAATASNKTPRLIDPRPVEGVSTAPVSKKVIGAESTVRGRRIQS